MKFALRIPITSRSRSANSAIIVVLLLLLLFPARTALSGNESGLSFELDNEISVAPTELKFLPAHNSEITVIYETSNLEIETVSEFDREGYSESEIFFGLEENWFDGELELDLLPNSPNLESLTVAGEIELSPKTSFAGDYSTEFPTSDGQSNPDAELELVFNHEINETVSIEIMGLFPTTDTDLKLTPAEIELGLDGLNAYLMELDTGLEFKENKPVLFEIGFDSNWERKQNFLPGMAGNIGWDISQKELELDQEFEFSFVTFFLESEVLLSEKDQQKSLNLKEGGISGLKLGPATLGLAKDFDSEEVELDLESDARWGSIQCGIELSRAEGDFRYGVDSLTGKLSLEPTDFSEMGIEAETDLASFPVEISFSTEYSF